MKIIIFTIAIAFSSVLQANSPLESVENRISQYASRNNVVMVIFEAKGDINSAMYNMKAAMGTRDPNGFINPYWIVRFLDEKASANTNCGVIIGQWYASGFPYRPPWENIMNHAIQENARHGIYLYTQDGEFRITKEKQSQAELLKKNCLEGTQIAQKKFNTLEHRDVRDPGAELGALLLFGVILGGASSGDYEVPAPAVDCEALQSQHLTTEDTSNYDPRCF